MLYALVDSQDAVLRFQEFSEPPATLAPAKGLRWLPVIDTVPTPGPGERLTGPVVTVTDGAVTRVWSAEPIPQAELAATHKRQVADAVQRHLDDAVRPYGYASALAAVSYLGDPNPQWDAQARAVLAGRSAIWAHCFAVLDQVEAGERPPPTPEELVAELPPIVWPD